MRVRVIAAFAALLTNISIANAAGAITHAPQQVPAFNWAGAYAGAEIGFNTNKIKFHGRDWGIFHKIRHKPTASVYAGYNLPLSQHVILSAEGNLDFLQNKQLTIFNVYSGTNVTGQGYQLYKEQLAADARFRLGYAQGHFMPYIAGGMSVIRNKALFSKVEQGINSDNRELENYLGWNIGAGMDYALPHNLILRADYILRKTENHRLIFIAPNGTFVSTGEEGTLKSHQLRIGAAYKF